jgi:serine O-acetyltransferase
MFRNLREGIAAIQERDPAATNIVSALVNYPGLHALLFHRCNHWLHTHGLRFFARWGSQCARFLTGIEIHPGAVIGKRFFIDHGMGVVIGETTIIGDDVTLYQGVTLGGTGKETGKRHPTLDDGVTVGVGASVLGAITVGARAKVGGGAVAVRDVPPDTTVVGIPARVVVSRAVRVKPQAAAAPSRGAAPSAPSALSAGGQREPAPGTGAGSALAGAAATEAVAAGATGAAAASAAASTSVAPRQGKAAEKTLPHENLPDPTIEVFATLMQRIKRLEDKAGLAELAECKGATDTYLHEIEDYAQQHFQDGEGI